MPLGIGAGLFAGGGQGLALAQQQAQQQQLNNLRIKQAQEEQAVAALLGKTDLSQLGGQAAPIGAVGGQMTPSQQLFGGGVAPPVAAQPTSDPGGGTNVGYIPLDPGSPPVAGLPQIQPGGQIPRDTSGVPIVGLPGAGPDEAPSMAGPQPVPSDATSTPQQASPPTPEPSAAATPSQPPQTPTTPAPIQQAMDANNISMGKDGVPILNFGGVEMPITDLIPKHVGLGDIQQAIMKSNPGADPGAVGLATLKLYDAVNKGATQDRQMASLILQSMAKSGNLQLGQQRLQQQRDLATGIGTGGAPTVAQQRATTGAAGQQDLARHRGVTESQGERRITNTQQWRQTQKRLKTRALDDNQAQRAIMNAGRVNQQAGQQLMELHRQATQLRGEINTLINSPTPNDAAIKQKLEQLNALQERERKMAEPFLQRTPGAAPQQPQQ